MTCEYCEDGRCPCGTGCESCAGTLTCGECHGQMRTENDRALNRHKRSEGRAWCDCCSRLSVARPAPSPADYEEERETRPQYYAKMMSMERCRGCHAPFQDVRNRPGSYTLRELMTCATRS